MEGGNGRDSRDGDLQMLNFVRKGQFCNEEGKKSLHFFMEDSFMQFWTLLIVPCNKAANSLAFMGRFEEVEFLRSWTVFAKRRAFFLAAFSTAAVIKVLAL